MGFFWGCVFVGVWGGHVFTTLRTRLRRIGCRETEWGLPPQASADGKIGESCLATTSSQSCDGTQPRWCSSLQCTTTQSVVIHWCSTDALQVRLCDGASLRCATFRSVVIHRCSIVALRVRLCDGASLRCTTTQCVVIHRCPTVALRVHLCDDTSRLPSMTRSRLFHWETIVGLKVRAMELTIYLPNCGFRGSVCVPLHCSHYC